MQTKDKMTIGVDFKVQKKLPQETHNHKTNLEHCEFTSLYHQIQISLFADRIFAYEYEIFKLIVDRRKNLYKSLPKCEILAA